MAKINMKAAIEEADQVNDSMMIKKNKKLYIIFNMITIVRKSSKKVDQKIKNLKNHLIW